MSRECTHYREKADRGRSPSAEESCMSQAPLRLLTEQQPGNADCSVALLGFGLPFNEVIGKPRDMRVADLPRRLTATQKGKRIAVQARQA